MSLTAANLTPGLTKDFIEIKIFQKGKNEQYSEAIVAYNNENKGSTAEMNLPQPDIKEEAYPYQEWFSKDPRYSRHGRMFLLRGIPTCDETPEKIRRKKGILPRGLEQGGRIMKDSLDVYAHQYCHDKFAFFTGLTSATTSTEVAKGFANDGFVYGILNVGSVTITTEQNRGECEHSLPGGFDWEDCIIYRQVKESYLGFKHTYSGSIFIRKSVLEKYHDKAAEMCQFFLERDEYFYAKELSLKQQENQSQQFSQIAPKVSPAMAPSVLISGVTADVAIVSSDIAAITAKTTAIEAPVINTENGNVACI